MPVRTILRLPNPVLRQKAVAADPADALVRRVIADLWDTLDSHHGVGIAAPQIGARFRVIAVDATRAKRPVENHGRLTLLNPRILESTGQTSFREGCLSVPDMVAHIRRAEQVTVAATFPDGKPYTLLARGFEAVIIQHEIDHLDGVLFIDRVHSARDIKPRLR